MPAFPLELFDHILAYLPRHSHLFVDDATLATNLPRREFTTLGTSACKFAILARTRYRKGEEPAESDEEDGGVG
jgi:hypothetical protein